MGHKAMQAEGVPAGGIYDADIKDWHIYSYWEHILGYKSVAPDHLPWSGVPRAALPKYAKNMCPQCLDYLSRAVIITTHWACSPAECRAIADGVNKVLKAAESDQKGEGRRDR